MRRLVSTFRMEVIHQYRQGFYFASVAIVFLWGAMISALVPWSTNLFPMYPSVMFGNMGITTFMFVGGLVLLEKSQRSLQGLAITPLRPEEYIFAKVGSLLVLVFLESGLLTFLAFAIGFLPAINWFWMIAGLVQGSILLTLLGFIVIVRFDSINEYLLPGGLLVGLLELPLLRFFGFHDNWFFYIIPTTGSMILMQRSLQDVESGKMIYAFIYPLIWIVIAFLWCRNIFRKHIHL